MMNYPLYIAVFAVISISIVPLSYAYHPPLPYDEHPPRTTCHNTIAMVNDMIGWIDRNGHMWYTLDDCKTYHKSIQKDTISNYKVLAAPRDIWIMLNDLGENIDFGIFQKIKPVPIKDWSYEKWNNGEYGDGPVIMRYGEITYLFSGKLVESFTTLHGVIRYSNGEFIATENTVFDVYIENSIQKIKIRTENDTPDENTLDSSKYEIITESITSNFIINNDTKGNTILFDDSTNLHVLNILIKTAHIKFDTFNPTITEDFIINTPKANVEILSDTIISGTNWNGILTTSTITSIVSKFDINFAFGSPTAKLSFSKPVLITLLEQAGSNAFITEFDGTQGEITTICNYNNAPTNIPDKFPQACKIDRENDLVIFTKTASIFSSGSEKGDDNNDNKKKRGGGCSGDCTPPTFGKNTQYKQVVQNGFSFNGNATDVTSYHTEYPLITVNTNQTNNVTVKAYENNGPNKIKWIQFGLGMPEVGSPLNDAQTLVTIYLKGGEVENIETREKYPLVDVSNVTTSIVACGYTTSDCLEVSMDYIYRDQPKYNVMAINAMDVSRNSVVSFLNDGILVVGESMNEPLLDTITAGKGGVFYPQRAGTVELTLIDYKSDTWQDEYGYLWSKDNNKSFKILDIIPVPIKDPDVMWSAMTRMNSNFADMIIHEKDRAVLHFDASKLISMLDETFAYDAPKSPEQKQAELDIKITDEIKRITSMTKDYTMNQSLCHLAAYNFCHQN